MTVEIESSIDEGSMAGMRVYAVAKAYGARMGKTPLLTAECRSEQEFNAAIDALIHKLEALKPKAKLKFDEYRRNPN